KNNNMVNVGATLVVALLFGRPQGTPLRVVEKSFDWRRFVRRFRRDVPRLSAMVSTFGQYMALSYKYVISLICLMISKKVYKNLNMKKRTAQEAYVVDCHGVCPRFHDTEQRPCLSVCCRFTRGL